jgi:broad specificity phosphatase PhoE
MKVYFVRHGESALNKEKVHQYAHTPLSEAGMEQAATVAKRLQDISFDKIYTSPYERAQQTAHAIVTSQIISLETTELLQEVKNPSIYLGKSYDDPEIQVIKKHIAANADDPSFKHSDEETFLDLTERIKQFTCMIEEETVDHILCVSHGGAIAAIVGYILFREHFSPGIYRKMKSSFVMDNTGITICERRDEGKWKLIAWNDTAHIDA